MQSYKSCDFPLKQKKWLYPDTVMPAEMQPALPTADWDYITVSIPAHKQGKKSHPEKQKNRSILLLASYDY